MMVKKVISTALLTLAAIAMMANPVTAAKPQKFIRVVDSFEETSGWAQHPIDAIWGQPITVNYAGSERGRFTCSDWTQTLTLTSESGSGVSVSIYPNFTYNAGTYTFCTAELLGKRDKVIASDVFVVYSPA